MVRPFFAIIPVALFLALATSHCIRSGLELDDSGYIALRVADNLRQGNGTVFNPGERRDLVDSPLWLGLLAIASSSREAPMVLQLAGLVFGAGVLIVVLAAPRKPVAGACASLFLGLDGLFAARATSGTSGLLAAGYLVGLYAVTRWARSRPEDEPPPDGILAGWTAAAAVVRYELVLVALPVALVWGLSQWRRLHAWLPLVVASLGAALCLYVRSAYFGALPAYWEPWPPSASGMQSGAAILAGYVLRRPLLVLGACVVVASALRRRFLPGRDAGIGLGVVALGGFALLPCAGQDIERQFVVLLPLIYLLAVESVWRATRARLGLVVALLLVAAQPAWTWSARTELPESRAAYARLGQWLGAHAIPGTLVGARQVGALGYYSGLVVVDALGQVSPQVAVARRLQAPTPYAVAALDFAAMLRQEPDLVLVAPSEPIPSSTLYVPNRDAIPPALRGSFGIYRWAGSPVWKQAGDPAAAGVVRTRPRPAKATSAAFVPSP